MKRRVQTVASWLGVGAMAVALFDGCGGVPAAAPAATATPSWMAAPVSTATPHPSAATPPALSVEPTRSGDVRPGEPVFDPAAIVAVLDDPELTEVAERVARGATRGAADALARRLRSAPPSDAAERAAWTYQLGRLRLQAGDPDGAIRAFERAGAVDWPLADYARYHTARLLIASGEPGVALTHLDEIASLRDELVARERAQALTRQRDVDGAAAIWSAHLASRPEGWEQDAIDMIDALLNQPSASRAERAVGVARTVLRHTRSRRWAALARQREGKALATLPLAIRRSLSDPGAEAQADRARMLAWSGQAREGLRAADAVIDGLREEDRGTLAACEAHLARAKALEGLDRDQEASAAADEAVTHCRTAAPKTRWVTALFLGGRTALAGGTPTRAERHLAELEASFPEHRFADDARVMRAEAAKNLGDIKSYTQLLATIGDDYPDGDMVDQALFDLAQSRMLDGDWAGALRPLERAVQLQRRDRPYYAEGRPQYYLARARLALGAEASGREGLRHVVRSFPLSYYAVLAYARLRAHDADAARRLVTRAVAAEPDGRFAIPDHAALHQPGFARAVALVRQGDGVRAAEELDALGVRAGDVHPSLLWASAFLLARIEAPSESHGLLRGQTSTWRAHHPGGVWRGIWEVAYPRPHRAIVEKEAKRSGIPEYLAYAIMREESAFKPGAVSHAGAYGLMQLILPTAERVARKLNLPSSRAALARPEVNIALGSRYLAMGMRRFAALPIMTVPGYNAGPGAPARWLRARPAADFDLWVEQIPYRETRRYTKRVIQSMAAYATLYGEGLESELLRLPLTVATEASLP
ncbi:MAG: transglycosylase SLT domain-containing protein [Myxococcota bacterium]